MRKYIVIKRVVSAQEITASTADDAIAQAVKQDEWMATSETIDIELVATDEQSTIYELFEKDDDQ
jgi:hypothetical protein